MTHVVTDGCHKCKARERLRNLLRTTAPARRRGSARFGAMKN